MNYEKNKNLSPEKEHANSELEQIRAEQIEKRNEQLKESLERPTESVETARHEALKEAAKNEKKAEKAEKAASKEASPAERRRPVSTKQAREQSFKKTMDQVQSEMTGPSRAFSKFIHLKPVEKTSEVLGSTVARPNAILSGAVFAFVLTLGVYIIAKHYGYVLSGFESIGSFIVGWVLGLVYDYLRVLVTGKH